MKQTVNYKLNALLMSIINLYAQVTEIKQDLEPLKKGRPKGSKNKPKETAKRDRPKKVQP
jgi:hypothetical protein